MSTTNTNILIGSVLKEDIYKDNILLLKKGIVLNSYLISKLNNFGIYAENLTNELDEKITNKDISPNNTEILICQNNIFDAKRTKSVLEFAGFDTNQIFMVSNLSNLRINVENISYIFVDSMYYNEDFLDNLALLNINKKLTIFVLGCENHVPKNLNINTDNQVVKFLYRPLANDYIKALLNLYS